MLNRRKQRTTFILQGGLGNQLFQIVAAKLLSLHFETEVLVGYSLIDRRNSHPSSVQQIKFGSKLRISESNINSGIAQTIRIADYLSKRSFIPKQLPAKIGYLFEPREAGYTDLFPNAVNHFYIKGYFQSYKYVHELEQKLASLLINEMTLKKPSPLFRNLQQEFRTHPPSIVHIRRGDYLLLKESFGVLDKSFFIDNILSLCDTVENKNIWIFSNEIDFSHLLARNLRENFGLNVKTAPPELSDVENLFLMAEGKNFVLSNSTFGWWAAWLSRNKGKVLYPTPWFKNYGIPNLLCPPNWIAKPALWTS